MWISLRISQIYMCVCVCVSVWENQGKCSVSLNLRYLVTLTHSQTIHLTLSISFVQSTNKDLASQLSSACRFCRFSTMFIVIWISLFKRWVAPEVHFVWLCVYRHFPFILASNSIITTTINTHFHCWHVGMHNSMCTLLTRTLTIPTYSQFLTLFMDFPSVPFLIYIYIVSKTTPTFRISSTQSIYHQQNEISLHLVRSG